MAAAVIHASAARPGREHGFSLLEALIALGIMTVVVAGVLPLAVLSTDVTENQGRLMSRTTRLAQDKLEQLLALDWSDATANTTVSPMTATGGAGLAPGGGLATAAPVAAYVDYLDIDSNVIASVGGAPPATWFFQRLWEVTSPRANLKQITVLTRARISALKGAGQPPQTTLSALKSRGL